jgi:hypothetical protein
LKSTDQNSTDLRVGPNGCHAAIIIRGEHFWCDQQTGHTGWPHGSTAAETIWRGIGPAEDPADTESGRPVSGAYRDDTASYVFDLVDPATEERWSIYRCDTCFALVTGLDAADHGEWHAAEATR